MNGVAVAGLPDRTFTRAQGCWNCINAKDPETTARRWFDHRERMLDRAMAITLNSPLGERDETVVRIRRVVEASDQAIAGRKLVACDVGITEKNEPVGDFVASAFLCRKWSGRTGHSLARHDDGKPDTLPEELREIVDGSAPISANNLLKKIQGEKP